MLSVSGFVSYRNNSILQTMNSEILEQNGIYRSIHSSDRETKANKCLSFGMKIMSVFDFLRKI